MSEGASVWWVLGVALLLATLPFVNERLFALIRLARPAKPFALRIAELAVFYGVTIGIGLLFERRAGQIAPQGWEFYAVTLALFAVLAFPGFTWRYLYKHHHPRH